jgi:hypothetical protein
MKNICSIQSCQKPSFLELHSRTRRRKSHLTFSFQCFPQTEICQCNSWNISTTITFGTLSFYAFVGFLSRGKTFWTKVFIKVLSRTYFGKVESLTFCLFFCCSVTVVNCYKVFLLQKVINTIMMSCKHEPGFDFLALPRLNLNLFWWC